MLEFDGVLEITGELGESIGLTGNGSQLCAEIGSLASGRPTLRLIRSGSTFVRRLSTLLARRKLRLLITRSDEPFLELGYEVRGGIVERLLRLPRARLYRRK